MKLLGNVSVPPKVRCECGAPFSGFRFRNRSGSSEFAFDHRGTLTGKRLVVDVYTMPLSDGLGVIGKRSDPKALPCPHCAAPLLEVRHTNCTALPLRVRMELIRSPDQTTVLEVVAEQGEAHGT